jgi:polysaccharide export outer membrane protein
VKRDETAATYVLGPQDQLTIWALDAEELSGKTFSIDASGYVNAPLIGRVKATGMTVQQFEAELSRQLKTYYKEPQVTVSVSEFRSQPVSVIGAVGQPGVHQLQGQKTLVEVLSMAGGLRLDAGHTIKITRRAEWGPVPLPGAAADSTGRFSVGEVGIKSVMEASNPQENILIKPNDVISVPRAEMVYVIGDVQKAGGYVLNERESLTILQVLSLAGGLTRTAAPQRARILRPMPNGAKRTEIAVDLKKILDGRNNDMPLQADDIFFIPNSKPKAAAFRAAEAAVTLGTGLVLYRR